MIFDDWFTLMKLSTMHRLRLNFFSYLLALTLISETAIASNMRILSETIVGDPPFIDQQSIPQPKPTESLTEPKSINIEDRVPKAFENVRVGRGSCPFPYLNPSACTGNLVYA